MERKNHIDENVVKRLSRIEGQIRGIKEMGVNGASCTDILMQISAVQSALKQVSKIVMMDHLEHCVVEGIQDGDIDQTLKDMSQVVERFSKMK
ncbi:MAG: metal-sensitive transcriptional regulator [Oscillospiraceae bacterium]|nr:metal-sensitive transcriptional regulator [Oscillospiraceae bacterium]